MKLRLVPLATWQVALMTLAVGSSALAAEQGPKSVKNKPARDTRPETAPANPDRVREALDRILAAASASWAAKDFAAVRAHCGRVLEMVDAPPQFRSYAHLRIAQSDAAEGNAAAARAEYAKIAADAAYPEVHRFEAKECLKKLGRVAQGLPARDSEALRTKMPAITRFAVEYFVSPAGSDANSGTREEPFASLEKARDAIRALKAEGGLPGPVCVRLLPGQYPVMETFQLTREDSGTVAASIVYRADQRGTAVLYGGKKLSGFAPVSDPAIINRLPEEARGRVWQCDLGKLGITDFSPLAARGGFTFWWREGRDFKPAPATMEVFFDGAPLTLARWPNSGFVNGGKMVEPGSRQAGKPAVFEYQDDRHARWAEAEDGWLFGYFKNGFSDNAVRIRRIDTASRRIACDPDGIMGGRMETVPYFNQGRVRYYAFNLLEELDRPGEWYLDRVTGMLYLYPPSEPTSALVEIGRLSIPMLTLANVSHVRLDGLTFDLSQVDCMSLSDCDNCLVAGCTVKRFAGSGITVRGGRDSGILGCDLFSLGRGGIDLTGGDRKTLTPAKHFVENCLMYQFGRIDRTFVYGVALQGVGIRVTHNVFCEHPSSVLRADGNDHVIEYNRVHRAALEAEDQGTMELYGNPTYRGVIFRYNHFSDVGAGATMKGPSGRAGIRLDNTISGIQIYGNVFQRASQSFGAININGGRDNIIDNNLFLDCEKAISGKYNANDRNWAKLGRDPAFILSELYLERYPDLRRLTEQPALNSAWRNVFWKCGPLFNTYGRPTEDQFDRLANIDFADEDPGFVDTANRDFRLRPDTPLLERIGFRPIPVEEIGLYEDAYRATWPVDLEKLCKRRDFR